MTTKLWAIGLLVLTTLLTSAAQLLYKAGIGYFPQYLDWRIVLGLVIYGVGAIFMLFALKGGEVTVLYPIVATSYIWVGIFSWVLFGESLNALKLAGILTIVAGIITLGIGANKMDKQEKTKAKQPKRGKR